MKPSILLLLLSACITSIGAQQVKPDARVTTTPPSAPTRPQVDAQQAKPDARVAITAPTRPQIDAQQTKPDARAATTAPTRPDEMMSCPRCNQDEQLVVDLIYYKQLLDILEEIDQQRNRINAGLLKSAHAELIRLRPNLATLLKTASEARLRPAAPVKKPAQPERKPVRKSGKKPVKKPAPRRGIDGLTVGHVNDENKELGIKPSVVLISNGRPRSLSVGSVIEHNRRKFKVVRVDYVSHGPRGSRHEVRLEDQANKQTYMVPWQ